MLIDPRYKSEQPLRKNFESAPLPKELQRYGKEKAEDALRQARTEVEKEESQAGAEGDNASTMGDLGSGNTEFRKDILADSSAGEKYKKILNAALRILQGDQKLHEGTHEKDSGPAHDITAALEELGDARE
ncbi:MAG: hypothetical protein M1383_03610 [Patescibacteria group bacterium]|nr:hypothetical protein [Patescibacteria group bacterium]